jgi:hypothetical protein
MLGTTRNDHGLALERRKLVHGVEDRSVGSEREEGEGGESRRRDPHQDRGSGRDMGLRFQRHGRHGRRAVNYGTD